MPFASVDQISSSAVCRKCCLPLAEADRRLILTTFGSQGVERIQMPPSVYFSQALFSRTSRSKNIVKLKTLAGLLIPTKKVLNDLPLQSQMEY